MNQGNDMNTTAIHLPEAPAQEPETATCPCASCGTPVTYECIWIAGMDFGRTLNQHCDACAARIDAEVEAQMRQSRREEREAKVRAMLPPDLLETDENHPDFNRPLWRAVSAWRPSPEAFWLGLVGPAGRCKTRCLALAAKASILRGNRVVWTTANRLLEAAHDRSNKDRQIATMAREHLADCLHAGVLVLDDLGKNEWTNAFESQFFQILDHRKNHKLPLLFSSNAHPEQFSMCLSDLNREPIIGRLQDRTTLVQIKP
jgi:DNA replication protein DnaC